MATSVKPARQSFPSEPIQSGVGTPSGLATALQIGEYYNRVLIQGKTVEEARVTGRKLRKALRGIGSKIAERITVRV